MEAVPSPKSHRKVGVRGQSGDGEAVATNGTGPSGEAESPEAISGTVAVQPMVQVASTTTVSDEEALAVAESVTVSVAVYVPPMKYVWTGLDCEECGDPSPKSQSYA